MAIAIIIKNPFLFCNKVNVGSLFFKRVQSRNYIKSQLSLQSSYCRLPFSSKKDLPTGKVS